MQWKSHGAETWRCELVWDGMSLYGVVWCELVWDGVSLYGVVWCEVVLLAAVSPCFYWPRLSSDVRHFGDVYAERDKPNARCEDYLESFVSR
jgi:hypothetical protein